MNALSRRSFLKTSAAIAVATAATQAVRTSPAGAQTQGLQAGLAVRDITPEPGIPMWGYSDRKGPSIGTLDPLHAHALVLRAGDDTVAIARIDMGRVPKVAALDRIRARVKKAGVDRVIFTASHTHGGPALEDETAPHCKIVEDRIGECLEEAAENLEPVQVGFGTTTFDVSHNRRKLLEDGRCLMMWRNEERVPTSPVDHEASLIKLERPDGTPLAVLVHFACHPVVLGGDNRQYTADYVGEMARIVKEETGAECLFLQGGCGDINPYLDKTPLEEGGLQSMHSVGRTCANAVIAALPNIKAETTDAPSLGYHEETVEVGTRWDFEDPKQQEIFRAIYGPRFDEYLKDLKRDLSVPLAVLVINDDIALACMPGEVFVQYQLDLKSHSPLPKTLLVGYSNDFYAYFPTIKDAAAGGYGGTVATYVGVGAGDKLVARSQIAVGELTNKLRAFCKPEDLQLLEADSDQA